MKTNRTGKCESSLHQGIIRNMFFPNDTTSTVFGNSFDFSVRMRYSLCGHAKPSLAL